MASRFQRGSGCYKCEACGRKTRNTGAQSMGSKTCEQCWDLAGIENEISDGHETVETLRESIQSLLAKIEANGGDTMQSWSGFVKAVL